MVASPRASMGIASAPILSIVIAVKDAAANLPRILASLDMQSLADVEITFVVAGEVPPALLEVGASRRVISAPAKTLIPQLWRDGILAASGQRVALTSAQCIPTEDWVKRLIGTDLSIRPGFGGAIANDRDARPLNWAIYFLRYAAYTPEEPEGVRDEIAADNAIYQRAAIMRYPELLVDGFWEPSFHACFRADGGTLWFDPNLVVEHHGLVPFGAFLKQRFSHGVAYGRARAGSRGLSARLALLIASPAVPVVLLVRIIGNIRRKPVYRGRLASALPWLVAFTVSWSLGEASGYLNSLLSRKAFHQQDAPGRGPGLGRETGNGRE